MKYFAFVLIMFAVVRPVFSQVKLPSKSPDSYSFVDSVRKFAGRMESVYKNKKLTHGEKIMTSEYYNLFFTRWLSYVNFAKDGYPDGNSVLVAPNSSSTRLRATLAHKANSVVFNAGTEVNFSNNIGNVISKSDVTSNTTFFTSFSFLPNVSRKIRYDVNRAAQNDADKIFLLDKWVTMVRRKYETDYSADSLKYKLLSDSVGIQGGHQASPRLLADYYASIEKLRSYGFNENSSYYDAGFLKDRIAALKDSMKQVIDSLELTNDAIASFKFNWISGAFAYTRNDYTTYDGNAAATKRIGDVFFDSLAFNAGYNFLFQRSQKYQKFHGTSFLDKKYIRSVYLTANYNLSRDINYAHLTAVNLLTTQNIPAGSTDSVYQLQSQGKGVNITNIPRVDSWLHTFSIKSVTIFTNSSVMGWDLSFSASYGKLVEPIYSAQAGVLFRFADSQTQKTKVNFELFLKLADFSDSQNFGKSTWQRKIVGINAAIPFGKLFF